MKTPRYHNEEDILDFFKDFLDEEDLENFIKSRILTRGTIIDDPLDFINGFSLALAYAFAIDDEEAKFRMSIAIWLNKYIHKLEHVDWQ